ncbi:hypothetical protein Tco_1079225 [Tanacetum coccineum]|uniref:Uncharacterized protein n=1 Tax=Tanacetum coccineum TaxID=301880 RepID=A0ABQ5HRP5_9ASTR
MPQRMARLEEDVHEIRGVLTGQREVIDAMARDFSKFSTWVTTGLERMMDRTGVTYTPYSKTHIPYQRRVRRRAEAEDIAACLVEYVKLWDDWEVEGYGNANLVIKKYLVKVNKRHAFWSLNKDILKITILKTNTSYSSRRYSVSMPELAKDHEGNKPIRHIQKKAIRRIKDIVCEDSGRYQAWSLLQETLIRRIQSLGYALSRPTPDSIDRKLKNEF